VDKDDLEIIDLHENNNGGSSISAAKLEANRRNAQLSTGPKTPKGKMQSRRNALKHGMLATDWFITVGDGAENATEFNEFLAALQEDLAPVGALEELLVEKIAICCWRQRRVLKCEAGMAVHDLAFAVQRNRIAGVIVDPILERINRHLTLPLSDKLDRLLRYETAVHRQLVYAINQLERLQRARKGEHVPAPVTLQVSTDHQALRTNKVKVRHFRVRYHYQVPFDLAKCSQSLAWRLLLSS